MDLGIHEFRCCMDGDGFNDAAEGNVISGSRNAGVVIGEVGSDLNVVAGNFIGTNKLGTLAVANGSDGVRIENGASNNTIGGTAVGARNIISGNTGGYGVALIAPNNIVQGNVIGLSVTGTALGNSQGVGVLANTNLVGGGVSGAGNVISGNANHGIVVSSSAGSRIQGNRIGTNAAGNVAVGNLLRGILLGGASAGNYIGTDGDGVNDATEGNVIAGNVAVVGSEVEILVTGLGTVNNVFAGNFIGTDPTGTLVLGKGRGILVYNGARATRIGTNADGLSDVAERNVISGNNDVGVYLAGTDGNVIAGNYIGVNAAGTAANGNGTGIFLADAPNNIIGGTAAAARNIISGNIGTGLGITTALSTGNLVQGNYIGLNAAGTGALPNGNGVTIAGGANTNTIGGAVAGARNIISGNSGDGVQITDAGSNNNRVYGNSIGTNAAGTAAIGNGINGVLLYAGASNNFIGTDGNGQSDDAFEGNVISGNAYGVFLQSSANNNVIAGNLIGTNAAGTAKLGNTIDGVQVFDGTVAGTRIGTNADGTSDTLERNVISGNTNVGVHIVGGTSMTVAGNYIGTNAAGTGAIANGSGIRLEGGATNNIIGGSLADTNPAIGNLVAFNGKGIYLDPTAGVGNTIRFNRVYGNGGLSGIVNDTNNPNTPTLTAALGGNSSRIFGGFQGVAGKSYLVDFYTSDAGGTAKVYLGSTNYLANGVGIVSIDSIFLGAMPFNTVITATATRIDTGSTSGLAVGTPALGAIIQGIPLNAVEGTPITLTAFTVLDTTGLSYQWSILKNGTPYADIVGSFGPIEAGMTFIPDDNGTFTVTLKLTSGSGGASTVGPVVIVVTNALPRPELRLNSDQVQAGSVVIAQAVGNDPGTADVVTFVWQVWYGPATGSPLSTGVGPNFSFTPVFNGFYRLRLTATDDDLGVSVVERLVESHGASPLASITLITSGNEGDPVQARAQVNEIANGEDLVFTWKVTKNGVAYPFTTPTEGAVQFVPNNEGTYRIDLRVRSTSSGFGTDAAPVFVSPGNLAPRVTITGPTTPAVAGAPVTFMSNATDPGSADTLSYQWTAFALGTNLQYGGISKDFTFTPAVGGPYQISLRVTDNSGASASTSQLFTVAVGTLTVAINGVPTADVAEGSSVNLTPAVVAGSYRYEWTATKDGLPYLTASSRTLANPNGFVPTPLAFPFSLNDNGRYVVTLQVTSPTNQTGVKTQSFKAFNVAPVPTIAVSSGPYIEGIPILFSAAPHDPGTVDTHTYTWKINGVPYTANPANPSLFKFVPPDNGIYTATVTVTDDDGGKSANISTAALSVFNANPTLSIRSGAPVANKVSLALDWSDVPADTPTVANWTVTAVTTTGNVTTTATTTGSGYTLAYAPAANTRYTLQWTAGDEDGGSSMITVASLVGTANNDTRVITAADVAGVNAVIYQGLAGNDTVSVAPGITVPVILDGGDGDDNLTGGDGAATLIAGTGKNTLTGGKGSNLFIGGGSDTMNGGPTTNRYMVHFSEVQINAGTGSTDTVDFSGITTSGIAVRFDGNPAYQFPFTGNTTSKLSLVGSFEGIVGTKLGDKFSVNTNNITVFGGEGDDNVTVDGGSNVSIDGGMGNDNVTISGGDLITVFGGDGNENVTVDGTAKNVQIIGGDMQFQHRYPAVGSWML